MIIQRFHNKLRNVYVFQNKHMLLILPWQILTWYTPTLCIGMCTEELTNFKKFNFNGATFWQWLFDLILVWLLISKIISIKHIKYTIKHNLYFMDSQEDILGVFFRCLEFLEEIVLNKYTGCTLIRTPQLGQKSFG